jgi:protein FAM50
LTPGRASSERPLKKKKRNIAKSKLSFGDDEEDGEDSTPESAAVSRGRSDSRSLSRTPGENSPRPPPRKITANPSAPLPPKALTKAALEIEAQERDALRREFLAMQEAVKNTEILIPFVFYDGTTIPGGFVRVKKGDAVWLFLDRCRKVGARLGIGGAQSSSNRMKKDNRKAWARVSVDDLMLVRGDIIIPHVSVHCLFPSPRFVLAN